MAAIEPPAPGVYVPAIKYYTYLSSTGLAGLVILGTNAETLLITREERKALLVTARQSVPASFPIIAGVSGHSTAQVLEYIKDAAEAGANYALVLPWAYFGKQTTSEVINGFFDDTIAAIASRNPSVVGVKLTCGSVAKITRLAATFPSSRFATFGGEFDFLLGGLAVGSAGCIAAFGNVFPRLCARLFRLWDAGERAEALALQQELALAESPTKAGIAATKYAASLNTAPKAGIEESEALLLPRKPYVGLTAAAKSALRERVEPLLVLENEP